MKGMLIFMFSFDLRDRNKCESGFGLSTVFNKLSHIYNNNKNTSLLLFFSNTHI